MRSRRVILVFISRVAKEPGNNKANLRDLMAATGLVILLKLDSNRRFFARVTLKFDGWPPKNNKARLLYYIKFCVSFQIHLWIQTRVTVRKRPILVKFNYFFSHVTLKLGGWPWKTIGYLFYASSSFVHHFVAVGEFKLQLQSGTPNLGQIRWFLEPCDLEIWCMTLIKTIGHLFSCGTSTAIPIFIAMFWNGSLENDDTEESLIMIKSTLIHKRNQQTWHQYFLFLVSSWLQISTNLLRKM